MGKLWIEGWIGTDAFYSELFLGLQSPGSYCGGEEAGVSGRKRAHRKWSGCTGKEAGVSGTKRAHGKEAGAPGRKRAHRKWSGRIGEEVDAPEMKAGCSALICSRGGRRYSQTHFTCKNLSQE